MNEMTLEQVGWLNAEVEKQNRETALNEKKLKRRRRS